MAAFLRFTDPDDATPVYVRASQVEAVVVIPPEKPGAFGIHPHDSDAPDGFTKLVLSGGGNVRVAELAEDVIADLSRSGR